MNSTLTYRPKSPDTNIGGYRYFFNGQEGDNEVFGEMANFGYEFRQYDSRLGRWWSVDPKWNEYPSVSPFVFCNGSPIMMADLKGLEEWIPEVDKKGNVTYTAEKGDNLYTFIKQFDCKREIAEKIFNKAGFGTGINDLKPDDVITGKQVFDITRSEILKGNWYGMDNNHRITYIIFAMRYAYRHDERNSNKNEDLSVDLTRFIINMPSIGILRYQYDNNKILLSNNRSITIHFMEISIKDLGNPPTVQYYPEGGSYLFKDTNGKSYVRYKYYSGANPNAKSRFVGILMSISAGDQEKYDELF